MQFSDTQTKIAVSVLVVVVIGLVYFLWSRSAPPEPVPGPNQTIKNPFGEARNPQPQTNAPSASGTPVTMPTPGTAQPGVGFGPSKGAPIPRSR